MTTVLEWFGKIVECFLFFMLVLFLGIAFNDRLALKDNKRGWVGNMVAVTVFVGGMWLMLYERFHWFTLLALLCLLAAAMKLEDSILRRRWRMPRVRLGSATIWIDENGKPGLRGRWFAKREDPLQELRRTVTFAQEWIAATEQKRAEALGRERSH